MNEKNLGVCFAPSLFHLCGTKEDPSSPKRQKRTPMNKASKELTDNLVSFVYYSTCYFTQSESQFKAEVLDCQILENVI